MMGEFKRNFKEICPPEIDLEIENKGYSMAYLLELGDKIEHKKSLIFSF